MKKFTILSLISIIFISGCYKKKPEIKKVKETVVIQDSTNSTNLPKIEDAEEFILDEDSGFNTFDDNQKSNKVEDDLSWSEVQISPEFKEEVVQFDYNSSKIKPQEESKISRNANKIKEKLSQNDKAKVVIKGHSCKIAKNKEYNYALSQERACNVAKEYEKFGIAKENIKSVGFGATMLITDEDSMDAQAINRRAETCLITQ